ncbi:hypothetical protein M758_10G014700 [Ceratodon purpureus]|nr:hypothetical protein M758_10G014700 [Ceratodon purpureus]
MVATNSVSCHSWNSCKKTVKEWISPAIQSHQQFSLCTVITVFQFRHKSATVHWSPSPMQHCSQLQVCHVCCVLGSTWKRVSSLPSMSSVLYLKRTEILPTEL